MDDSQRMRGVSRRDFLALAGTAGVMLVGVAACGAHDDAVASEAATQVVTDMGGTEVTVPVEPKLYADAWYAHNEVTIMLTKAEGLVATHCTPKGQPWMFYCNENINGALQTFGDDFNYEELVALGPQVVFDSKDTMREKLGELGIPLVNCTFSTFEQMEQSITMSAQVFGGDAPAIAEKYNAELEQTVSDVKAVTDAIATEDRPKVMHGPSVYTYNLDGTGTIIDTWINAAGGVNVVDASTTGTAEASFSLEQIIAWNPDVIITGTPSEVDQILHDESWASISAVQKGQVYVNPKGVFGWDRYGVEELLQVPWAANLLHPDLFPDLDITQRVKDFYHTYLYYDLTDEEVKLILAAGNPPTDGTAVASSAADSAGASKASSAADGAGASK